MKLYFRIVHQILCDESNSLSPVSKFGAWLAQSVQCLDYGRDNPGIVVRILQQDQDIFLFSKPASHVLGHNNLSTQWILRALSPRIQMTIQIRLVPRLRDSGAIPPLRLVVMWCTWKVCLY
jgi:hypothetical protein